MKRNAVGTLVKDIIFAVAAWGIFTALIGALWGTGVGGTIDAEGAQFLGLFFAGLPFGWRWASHIITAVSPKGIAIKFAISVFLGWFAIFIVLIVDIIRCITAKAASGKSTSRARETT